MSALTEMHVPTDEEVRSALEALVSRGVLVRTKDQDENTEYSGVTEYCVELRPIATVFFSGVIHFYPKALESLEDAKAYQAACRKAVLRPKA